MTAEGQVGIRYIGDGGETELRLDKTSALVVTDGHAKYTEAVLRGNVYVQRVGGATATAFTGGAAGTPLLSVYNPVGSGRNLVVLGVGVASRAAASAAGVVGFNLWAGVSVLPTGTATPAVNLYSQQAAGSSAVTFVNTANTSGSATTLVLPLGSYYWATAAGAIFTPSFFDVAGMIVVAPGVLLCLGATAALTSATYDASLIWEEIPII